MRSAWRCRRSPPITLGLGARAGDLLEYGDFECPSCKVAVQTPKLLLDRFPNKIRFIFRHFPLQEAHPHALMAAEVAEAAAAQGKFWSMHDVLFQNQAHLKDKDLYRYAGGSGSDMARYTAEMDDHIYLQKVREHVEGGRRSHIRATPDLLPRRRGAGYFLRHEGAARRGGQRRRAQRLGLTGGYC